MRPTAKLHLLPWTFGFLLATLSVHAGSEEGKAAFEKRCGGCHSVDRVKEGPSLRGVIGRPAGREGGPFPYSNALKAADFRWDEAKLDQWLTDPESLLPGNDMPFRLNDRAERARIIAYLKEMK